MTSLPVHDDMLLTIATAQEPGDGVLYPRWRAGDDIAFEPADGLEVLEAPVSRIELSVEVGARSHSVANLVEVPGRMVITDQRVAVVCPRVGGKGGGWWGFGGAGAAFAATANAVSGAIAAKRNHGKALVGHVFHRDLLGAASERARDHDVVRVRRRVGETMQRLDLHLARDFDGAKVLAEITRRAAKHQTNQENVR